MQHAANRGSLKTCVWELTLACNARCIHCGSNAGDRRKDELSCGEALALIDDLAGLGCEEITLSGGEPLMRKDWRDLTARIVERGIKVSMISNGLEVERNVDAISTAGFFSIGLSVDGPPEIHDRIRRVPGGFERLVRGARALVERGGLVGAVTHINRVNLEHLDTLHDLLVGGGFEGWQVQLTMPHGRAGEGEDPLCLAREQLPELESRLMAIRRRTPLFFQAADNIGYMSRFEPRLRAGTPRADKFYTGCYAGLNVIGITSDGTVRGCLSMPPVFDEGNVRRRSLTEIWNDPEAFPYNRRFTPEKLTDTCEGCAFGKICRGGCRSMAYAVTGGTTCNPYCLHSLSREILT